MPEKIATPFDLRSGRPERSRGAKGTEDAKRGPAPLAFGIFVIVVFSWLSFAPLSATAEPLTGRVEYRVKPGATPALAVVYAEPLDGPAPARSARVSVMQKNKAFAPRVLGLPVGSTVTFPNDDAIFHNVFSRSAPQPFDLGLYRAGASKSRTFTQPAVYHVFCNIHPQMAAFLVVAPSPWVTTPGSDGMWRLDVPAGRYRVTALSERAQAVSVDVQVGAGAIHSEITLDESVFVLAQHLNKFGKPYPREAYKQ